MFFSLLAWAEAADYRLDLALSQGLISIAVIMLAFGFTAACLGIDQLMDNIP